MPFLRPAFTFDRLTLGAKKKRKEKKKRVSTRLDGQFEAIEKGATCQVTRSNCTARSSGVAMLSGR